MTRGESEREELPVQVTVAEIWELMARLTVYVQVSDRESVVNNSTEALGYCSTLTRGGGTVCEET